MYGVTKMLFHFLVMGITCTRSILSRKNEALFPVYERIRHGSTAVPTSHSKFFNSMPTITFLFASER